MKKITILTAAFIFSAVVFAQSNKEDVDLIQSIFGKEKKELVKQYMTIPEAKSAGFWKLYDAYEDERKKLGRERIKIIEEYADNYDKLDDKKASALATKKLAWATKYTQFQQKYFTKFSTAIGGLQATKLLQLEDYIENCIRVRISEEIPFIGELDKEKLPGQ
jgi:hypothetical protein